MFLPLGEQRRTSQLSSLLVIFSKPFVGEGFWWEGSMSFEKKTRREDARSIQSRSSLCHSRSHRFGVQSFSALFLMLGNNVIHHLIFLTSDSFISGFLNSLDSQESYHLVLFVVRFDTHKTQSTPLDTHTKQSTHLYTHKTQSTHLDTHKTQSHILTY